MYPAFDALLNIKCYVIPIYQNSLVGSVSYAAYERQKINENILDEQQLNCLRIKTNWHNIEQLLKHIKGYHRLSSEAESALHDCMEQVVLSKNDFLVSEGKLCRHLYFLQQGALRGFYNLEGKEITHWFAFENDFVTSFHSFITQQPAVETIQLLEGSILWAISKDNLNNLLNQYQEIERLVRIAYEKYYIRLEERFVNAQFKTASERYANLLLQTPHIIERVPLGCIASYLGISQETLSRIRSHKS